MSVQVKTVKTNCEEYLNELLKEVELKKMKHKHMVYRVNDRITDEVANYVKAQFSSMEGYDLELTKCKKTKDQWDLIIIF